MYANQTFGGNNLITSALHFNGYSKLISICQCFAMYGIFADPLNYHNNDNNYITMCYNIYMVQIASCLIW